MLPLQDVPSYLVESAFTQDATSRELFAIAIAFGFLWCVVFAIARPVLRSISYGKPWLRKACERDYDRGGKDWYESAGIEITKEEAVEDAMKGWPTGQVINIQHLAGAALCIPSVLGIGDPSWASSLAACGVLSEMGWELQHFVVDVLYVRFFTADGAKKVTNIFLFIAVCHHGLASGLGLPMVLHYRELRALHWLCFDLQLGAASGILTEYSRILDISKPKDLRKFKVVNFLLLALMAWTRLIHWVYLCIQIFMIWYQEKAWTFIIVGALPIAGFSLFNVFLCVIPMYQRFMKFLHKSAEYESLSPSEPEQMRRQSMANLEGAVAELLEEAINVNPQDGLESWALSFLESTEGKVKLDRRKTMPPRRRTTMRSAMITRGMSVPGNLLKKD